MQTDLEIQHTYRVAARRLCVHLQRVSSTISADTQTCAIRKIYRDVIQDILDTMHYAGISTDLTIYDRLGEHPMDRDVSTLSEILRPQTSADIPNIYQILWNHRLMDTPSRIWADISHMMRVSIPGIPAVAPTSLENRCFIIPRLFARHSPWIWVEECRSDAEIDHHYKYLIREISNHPDPPHRVVIKHLDFLQNGVRNQVSLIEHRLGLPGGHLARKRIIALYHRYYYRLMQSLVDYYKHALDPQVGRYAQDINDTIRQYLETIARS